MSTSSETPWYRLGYALERARTRPTASRLRPLGERLAAFRDDGRDGEKDAPLRRSRPDEAEDRTPTDGGEVFDDLLLGGAAAIAVKLLRSWPARHRSRWSHVVRSAAAGAGATLLREASAPLLRGRFEAPDFRPGLGNRLLSGAARGALYGGFVDPRLPGHPAMKGLLYGTFEYFAAPYGGLSGLLSSVAPWARIPGAKAIIGEARPGEESWLEYVVFGMAMAILAGVDVDLAPLLEAAEPDDEVYEVVEVDED